MGHVGSAMMQVRGRADLTRRGRPLLSGSSRVVAHGMLLRTIQVQFSRASKTVLGHHNTIVVRPGSNPKMLYIECGTFVNKFGSGWTACIASAGGLDQESIRIGPHRDSLRFLNSLKKDRLPEWEGICQRNRTRSFLVRRGSVFQDLLA